MTTITIVNLVGMVYDFIPGITIDSQNGRIIFTTKTFWRLLFLKLKDNNATDVSVYNTPTTYNEIKRNV
jgi:hypothetical protein